MQHPGIKKNDILENIKIEKLVLGGKGFARLKHENPDLDGRVIFVNGGVVPESIVNLRVIKKKKAFLETQVIDVVKKSPFEEENLENKYGMCGGCKWVNIKYEKQLEIKENQVREALRNLFKSPPSPPLEGGMEKLFLPIEPSPIINGYRNKVEFSFGKYISKKEGIEEHFNVGFHKQGEFSKIQDVEGCILIDEIQNEIFRKIKSFTKTLGLPVYDQFNQKGFFRHILIRRTHFADEIMILLSFNPDYFDDKPNLNKQEKLDKIKIFLISLTKLYSQIKSIYFSHNVNKADTAIGDLELIYGKETIVEELLGLKFNISPTSFFQTNSSGAARLYELVLDFASPLLASPAGRGIEQMTVLDLYGGTGTIGMIFAQAGAKKVISVEMVESASKDGEKNAKLNKLDNIEFKNAKVEDFLEEYSSAQPYINSKKIIHPPTGTSFKKGRDKRGADLLIIDPARAGMHPKALANILKFDTKQIIYVSCNPATLARDLDHILTNSNYKIEKIKAMDMFPHTHHIETIVSLIQP